jgi:hypothetical protein
LRPGYPLRGEGAAALLSEWGFNAAVARFRAADALILDH